MISQQRRGRGKTFIRCEILAEPEQEFEVSFKTKNRLELSFKLLKIVVGILLFLKIIYLPYGRS